MSRNLYEHLINAYGSAELNEVLDSKLPIRVDDHSQNDFYYLFCRIHVLVKDDHNFDLQLLYVPTNAAVLQLVREVGGEVVDIGSYKDIRINLHASDGPYLQRL